MALARCDDEPLPARGITAAEHIPAGIGFDVRPRPSRSLT
jgi:hypothetical protein